ncbi:MAG TPA: HAMP domain-containing sensor histidine kinase [Mycobacteriales bacterium]|nr:HAMP domain-containing sensor histidine kinase [Mycobacteriales bacterium]
MTRTVLVVAWLVLAVVPFGWWLINRRRVDIWRALPVPTAILDRSGTVRARTGPDSRTRLEPAGPLPPAGRVVHTQAGDGTALAVSGLRGGALVVALPVDPVRQYRDRVLLGLGARLAHEVNTPIHAVYGHLDLIAHEPISPAARESVRVCQRELSRLQATAEDLLALTHLRAGGSRRGPHPAGVLAEEAAAAFVEEADVQGVVLRVEVPHERVSVEVADADIVRALRNLIANALRHGSPPGPGAGTEVAVAVDADADTVTFSVRDHGRGGRSGFGSGVLPGEAPSGEGPSGEGPSGTGLGLAIVAEILAAHASTLQVSPAQPAGTLASFTLPRQRP